VRNHNEINCLVVVDSYNLNPLIIDRMTSELTPDELEFYSAIVTAYQAAGLEPPAPKSSTIHGTNYYGVGRVAFSKEDRIALGHTYNGLRPQLRSIVEKKLNTMTAVSSVQPLDRSDVDIIKATANQPLDVQAWGIPDLYFTFNRYAARLLRVALTKFRMNEFGIPEAQATSYGLPSITIMEPVPGNEAQSQAVYKFFAGVFMCNAIRELAPTTVPKHTTVKSQKNDCAEFNAYFTMITGYTSNVAPDDDRSVLETADLGDILVREGKRSWSASFRGLPAPLLSKKIICPYVSISYRDIALPWLYVNRAVTQAVSSAADTPSHVLRSSAEYIKNLNELTHEWILAGGCERGQKDRWATVMKVHLKCLEEVPVSQRLSGIKFNDVLYKSKAFSKPIRGATDLDSLLLSPSHLPVAYTIQRTSSAGIFYLATPTQTKIKDWKIEPKIAREDVMSTEVAFGQLLYHMVRVDNQDTTLLDGLNDALKFYREQFEDMQYPMWMRDAAYQQIQDMTSSIRELEGSDVALVTFPQLLEYMLDCNTFMLKPKYEVIETKKFNNKTRNICVPPSIFAALLNQLCHIFVDRCLSTRPLTATATNEYTTSLSGFASNTVYGMSYILNRLEAESLNRLNAGFSGRVFFGYSDNAYYYLTGEAPCRSGLGPLMVSMDVAKMEGSSSISDGLACAMFIYDAAFKNEQSLSDNSKSKLLHLLRLGLGYMAHDGSAVFGGACVTVPGMASGVPPTFIINHMRMTSIGPQIQSRLDQPTYRDPDISLKGSRFPASLPFILEYTESSDWGTYPYVSMQTAKSDHDLVFTDLPYVYKHVRCDLLGCDMTYIHSKKGGDPYVIASLSKERIDRAIIYRKSPLSNAEMTIPAGAQAEATKKLIAHIVNFCTLFNLLLSGGFVHYQVDISLRVALIKLTMEISELRNDSFKGFTTDQLKEQVSFVIDRCSREVDDQPNKNLSVDSMTAMIEIVLNRGVCPLPTHQDIIFLMYKRVGGQIGKLLAMRPTSPILTNDEVLPAALASRI
jgi:hypothetical protein